VIVANVESGSPTLIAKIYPNEVITRLDDDPLTSPRQMRDLIAKAHRAGREKVRVTVLRLGKTRQADLAITEYDPADDEGLDEK
jgi:S1-C subfamily serine protease